MIMIVSPSSLDENAENEWHLFNDFLVQPTSATDALQFDPAWKLPSVFAYQLKALSHMMDNSWKTTMDTSLLYNCFSPKTGVDHEELAWLRPEEGPAPGSHVGIDAEFVSLQSEEIEIKADGTRETVRPSRLALARVSVLRGQGPLEDVPFIDDYIAINEPVMDYLTAFSGIRPGDLDPTISSHSLVTLKMAYKKLWLLLNLGCVFVGHGLLKDFRTINIHVPRGQVIDTVDLWFIKARARKLNLRFLAWLLLNEDIQSGESHDSIEDARSALRLWRKYVTVQSKGKTEETLEWIYRRGRELGFRAPNAAGLARAVAGEEGRSTPELPAPPGGVGMMAGKKMGFGVERVGFGSPLK
jgi:PAB-dependent poly(A)-specific ribonuclease subunit 2